MSTPCERALYASPSSSAASTPQEQQQQGHSEIVPTAPSVPSATLNVDSLALTSIGSSSATSSSSSASLTLLHSSTSIFQQQWPQQHPATVPWPTDPSPPSSPTVTPQTMAFGPPSLPSSTMTTSADVGSSSLSSSILALPSFSYDQPSSLAPLVPANPVQNVPMETSFKDPALAERYWNYDHQNVSLSDAVAAERAFGAALRFVKRRLGSGEQPPWFWGQNLSTYITRLKSEDIDQEEENVCAICLEEFKEHQLCRILLRCFHSFHCFCLLEWWVCGLPVDQELNCPLCASIVPKNLPCYVDG